MVQHGGLVYYGGLIGSSIAGLTYLAWKKAPVWKIADVLAPSHRAGVHIRTDGVPAQRLLLWVCV